MVHWKPVYHHFYHFFWGGRYLFGSTTLTWADALTHCEDQQATLATFPGDHVTPVWTVDGEMVWIGLSGLRRWYWSETGNDPTFMNWTTYEFSDQTGEENCAAVELQNGTWTDEQCNATYPFFCYGSMNHIYLVLKLELDARHDIAAVFCCTHHILSAEVVSVG